MTIDRNEPSVSNDSPLLRIGLNDRLALRPREAAHVLGVSERTLRTLLPQLPHVRLGGVVLIPVEALRKWLEERVKIEESRTDAVAREILEAMSEPAPRSSRRMPRGIRATG